MVRDEQEAPVGFVHRGFLLGRRFQRGDEGFGFGTADA